MRIHDHKMDEDILLPDHHRRLEKYLDELKAAEHDEDRSRLRQAWAKLEDELCAHFAAEEEYLLPPYAEAHPEDAASIRAEHAEMRRLLGELGVSVDLKRLSPGVADELLERLRAHARHEDEVLYPWATQNPSSRWPHFLEARRRPH
jgi:hemerythrin